jgi:hypothetical protein
LKHDIGRLRPNGTPLRDGTAILRIWRAGEHECSVYREAANGASSQDGELVVAYLVELAPRLTKAEVKGLEQTRRWNVFSQ